MNVLVLGGGSTAYACAADLYFRGHDAKIFSIRTDELQPIRDTGGIEATGVISGFARIALSECLHTELLDRINGLFSLQERHLSEDVQFGLVAWCSLGGLLGVATPVSYACCVLASVLNQEDYLSNGAILERLGINRSWNVDELRVFLKEGLL